MVLVPVCGRAREVLWRAVESAAVDADSRREYASYLEPSSGAARQAARGAHEDAVRYVPHSVLFDACGRLRASGADDAPRFEQVLRELASKLVTVAKQKENERPEETSARKGALQKRLAALERRQADLTYARMVSDVAPLFAERAVYGRSHAASEYIATMRAQMSVGANVVATMLTCFAVGYFLARVYYGDEQPTPALIGGAVGLTIGLFIDVIIIIARMYAIEKATSV